MRPGARAHPCHPGYAGLAVDDEPDGGLPEPDVDIRLAVHGIVQRGLQHDAPRLDGDQVLVPGASGRALCEPLRLVAFARSQPEHRVVHVGGFLAQHGTDRRQEPVGLHGLGHPGPPPVEEVRVEIGPRPAPVPLQHRDGVPPTAQEQRGGQTADPASDYRDLCRYSSPCAVSSRPR